MNRAPKEFEHSVVNFVSYNSSAGVCDNNRSPKCKFFPYLYKRLLFIDFTSAVHATACLSLYWMASNLPYFIMILIQARKRLMTFCFTDLSTFFTWWWSHVNTAMTRKYVYFTNVFTIARCQILSLKKQIW